jgi:hypothetical protein
MGHRNHQFLWQHLVPVSSIKALEKSSTAALYSSAQGSAFGAMTVGDLLSNRTDLRSAISGYHVVAGAYPSSALTPGMSLPTVDVERTPGQPDRPVPVNVTAPYKVSRWAHYVHQPREHVLTDALFCS